MLRAGRTAGVFQFESPLATDMLQEHALRPLRRSRRVERAHAPGPARRRHAQASTCARKRGEEPVSYALPELETILETDVRRHHLSGAGDAHRADARRDLARRSRRAAQGRGQEGRGADRGRARQVRRARRSRAATSPRDHRGDRGPDRDVRPLRLQQVALGRLLDHLVPHRVAQDALPGRVHGGAPVVADRRRGLGREVHQRGARARASRCCRPM